MLPPVPCVAPLSCSVSSILPGRSPSVWTRTVVWAWPSGACAGKPAALIKRTTDELNQMFVFSPPHSLLAGTSVCCSVYSGHQSILVPPLELESNASLWLTAVSQYKVRVSFCSYSVMEMCTKGLGSQTEALRVSLFSHLQKFESSAIFYTNIYSISSFLLLRFSSNIYDYVVFKHIF